MEPGDTRAHGDAAHDRDDRIGANERSVRWAMLLTGGFMLVEVAGGLFSGSLALLADAVDGFEARCLRELRPDRARIAEHVERSLMLVTALSPRIGYDAAAAIARDAHARGVTLREAAIDSGRVSADEFDAWVRPETMVGSEGG